MELPQLDTCVRQYKERFDPLYPEEHRRFRPAQIRKERIQEIEREVGVRFPPDYLQIISTYDFGNLNVGHLSFSYDDDYDGLELNNSDAQPWWGRGSRPPALFMIAFTSGWAILLDSGSRGVFAFEGPWTGNMELIAIDFDMFMRAACISVLRNPVDSGQEAEFLANLGNPKSQFWKQHLRSFA